MRLLPTTSGNLLFSQLCIILIQPILINTLFGGYRVSLNSLVRYKLDVLFSCYFNFVSFLVALFFLLLFDMIREKLPR